VVERTAGALVGGVTERRWRARRAVVILGRQAIPILGRR